MFEDQKGQINRLATDQQLIALLRASKLVKFTMTIDRCEHGQNVTQMNEHQLVVSSGNDLVRLISRCECRISR